MYYQSVSDIKEVAQIYRPSQEQFQSSAIFWVFVVFNLVQCTFTHMKLKFSCSTNYNIAWYAIKLKGIARGISNEMTQFKNQNEKSCSFHAFNHSIWFDDVWIRHRLLFTTPNVCVLTSLRVANALLTRKKNYTEQSQQRHGDNVDRENRVWQKITYKQSCLKTIGCVITATVTVNCL